MKQVLVVPKPALCSPCPFLFAAFSVFISLLFFNTCKVFWKMADSESCGNGSLSGSEPKLSKGSQYPLHTSNWRQPPWRPRAQRRSSSSALLPAWGKGFYPGPMLGKDGAPRIECTPFQTPDPEKWRFKSGLWLQRLGQSGKASWRRDLGGWFKKGRRPGQRGEKQGTCLGSWALDDLSTTRCAGNLLSGPAPVRAVGVGRSLSHLDFQFLFLPWVVSFRDGRSSVGFQRSWHVRE